MLTDAASALLRAIAYARSCSSCILSLSNLSVSDVGGALGKGDVLDARSFLITLAPAGPAPPAMFAPELELLLLFLSLSFLMKEGLKLPILKFFFSFLFSVVEETVESSFLGKLNSGTVLNGSPNPVSLRVAVFGLIIIRTI